MSRQVRINLLLSLLCLLIGSGLVSAMTAPKSVPATLTVKADTTRQPTQRVRFQPPSIGTFGDLTERPIFSETRRPEVKSRRQAQQTPAPRLLITGFIEIGGAPRALVQIDGNPTETVQLNTLVGSWRVTEVGNGTLTLSLGARDVKYTLGEVPSEVTEDGPAKAEGPRDVTTMDMSDRIDE